MEVVFAVVIGASLGVLFAQAQVPVMRWAANMATAAMLAVVLYFSVSYQVLTIATAVVLVLSICFAQFTYSGILWRSEFHEQDASIWKFAWRGLVDSRVMRGRYLRGSEVESDGRL